MATTAKARSRRKPERRIRLLKPIHDGMGALQILIDGEHHNYLIFALPSDFGAAFRLIKQEFVPQEEGFFELEDVARYNVCLEGERSSCECIGFSKHGRCKHVSGLSVLRDRGLI